MGLEALLEGNTKAILIIIGVCLLLLILAIFGMGVFSNIGIGRILG